MKKTDDSILHDLFAGHLLQQVSCTSCRKTARRHERRLELSLPCPHAGDKAKVKLEELIAAYFQDEYSSETKCPDCNQKAAFKHRTTIVKPPAILIIHLQRFEPTTKKRDKASITFLPEKLDLSTYTETKAGLAYRLYAVVNHIGELATGHFSA